MAEDRKSFFFIYLNKIFILRTLCIWGRLRASAAHLIAKRDHSTTYTSVFSLKTWKWSCVIASFHKSQSYILSTFCLFFLNLTISSPLWFAPSSSAVLLLAKQTKLGQSQYRAALTAGKRKSNGGNVSFCCLHRTKHYSLKKT